MLVFFVAHATRHILSWAILLAVWGEYKQIIWSARDGILKLRIYLFVQVGCSLSISILPNNLRS